MMVRHGEMYTLQQAPATTGQDWMDCSYRKIPAVKYFKIEPTNAGVTECNFCMGTAGIRR